MVKELQEIHYTFAELVKNNAEKDDKFIELAKKIYKCSNCPLGIKQIRTKEGKTVQIPPLCSQYNAERETCVYEFDKWLEINKKIYSDLTIFDRSPERIYQSIISDILRDAQLNRSHEIARDGRPKGYTLEYMRLAFEGIRDYMKTMYGEKQINVNVTDQKKDPSQIILDILRTKGEENGKETDIVANDRYTARGNAGNVYDIEQNNQGTESTVRNNGT